MSGLRKRTPKTSPTKKKAVPKKKTTKKKTTKKKKTKKKTTKKKKTKKKKTKKKATRKHAVLVVRPSTPEPVLPHHPIDTTVGTWFPASNPVERAEEAVVAVSDALAARGVSGTHLEVVHTKVLPWPTARGPAKANTKTPKSKLFIVRYAEGGKSCVAFAGPATWILGPVDYDRMRRKTRNETLLEIFIGMARAHTALTQSKEATKAGRAGADKSLKKHAGQFEGLRLVDAVQLAKRNFHVFIGQKQGQWYYVTDDGRQFGFDRDVELLHPLAYYLGLAFEPFGNPLARLRKLF